MKIKYTLDFDKNSALALGFFDGVHLAHQAILKKTAEFANENSIKSIVLTFQKSPYSTITGKTGFCITDCEKKLELIKNCGINSVYLLNFEEFMNLEPKEYIKDVLIKYFEPKFVATGFNHTFGKEKKGTPKELYSAFGNKYYELKPVYLDNSLVSSTNIRLKIKEGDFETASKMLNRNFSIKGVIQRGQGIARSLGYKTANLFWNKEIIKPPYGVYFGKILFEGNIYKSIINFGIRPSVDKNKIETLEAHLFDFSDEIYGREIEVFFISKIRDEKKFSSIDALKAQIDKDYSVVKSLFL